MKAASITLIATIHGFAAGRQSTGRASLISAGMAVVLIFQFNFKGNSVRPRKSTFPEPLQQVIAAAFNQLDLCLPWNQLAQFSVLSSQLRIGNGEKL
jgi:hypothetical protein